MRIEKFYKDLFYNEEVSIPHDAKESISHVLDSETSILNERSRIIMDLYYIQEKKQSEIAKLLNMSRPSVHQSISTSLTKIKRSADFKYLTMGYKAAILYNEIMDKKVNNFSGDTKLAFKEFGQVSVRELDIQTKTQNSLMRQRIENISDFENQTQHTISLVRNIGESAVKEILDALAKYHITLPEN